MADAVEVQLCNAVVAELNDPARPWHGQFTAYRLWLPRFEEDRRALLKDLQVTVGALTIESETLTRKSSLYQYGVYVDLQQDADFVDTAKIDGLCSLAEAIADWFGDLHRLATMPAWQVANAVRPNVFLFDTLDNEGTFESYIELTLKGAR